MAADPGHGKEILAIRRADGESRTLDLKTADIR